MTQYNVPSLYDADLVLKTSGAVTSDTNHTAVNLGARAGVFKVVIIITAIDVANADEKYEILLQGSPDGGTTYYNLAQVTFGDTSVLYGDDPDTATGVEVFYAANERRVPSAVSGRADVLEDVRLTTQVTGTSPSITYEAFMTAVGHGG